MINNNENLPDANEVAYRIWSEQKNDDSRWKDIVVEFFKRVMPDNPHLTLQEKKIKLEARQLFLKEVLKNL